MSTSDTPRPTPETDAFIAAGPGDLYDYISALADHARKLERERNEWRDQFHAAIENVRGLEQLLDRAERERDEAREVLGRCAQDGDRLASEGMGLAGENTTLHCLLQEAKRGADLANTELKELREENAALRADKARLVDAFIEYQKLLCEELDELVPIASAHGWKSLRYEEGVRLRAKIDAAMQEGRV